MQNAASTTVGAVAATPLNLDEVEHEQLDILARRLWFFMRSRLRTELLIDRERSGTLSDFIR
jgi:hypothetical protein